MTQKITKEEQTVRDQMISDFKEVTGYICDKCPHQLCGKVAFECRQALAAYILITGDEGLIDFIAGYIDPLM